MNIKTTHNQPILESRITRHLMLQTSCCTDIGLYHGKMGIVLFFAHYARYTDSLLYDDFAGELLDEIYEEIHADIPINFESGLCGIGWGIEYLLDNSFMEGDSTNILSDIDRKIMEHDIRRLNNQSLRTGIGGISCYIQKRIDSANKNQQEMPFDEIYLKEWKDIVSDMPEHNDLHILFSIMKTLPKGDDIISWDLGLENGCAGVGLQKILLS